MAGIRHLRGLLDAMRKRRALHSLQTMPRAFQAPKITRARIERRMQLSVLAAHDKHHSRCSGAKSYQSGSLDVEKIGVKTKWLTVLRGVDEFRNAVEHELEISIDGRPAVRDAENSDLLSSILKAVRWMYCFTCILCNCAARAFRFPRNPGNVSCWFSNCVFVFSDACAR